MNTKDIVTNSADITLDKAIAQQHNFCNIWPNVKAGLVVLQGIIKNPIAKGAIGIVIAAGDAVAKQVCG